MKIRRYGARLVQDILNNPEKSLKKTYNFEKKCEELVTINVFVWAENMQEAAMLFERYVTKEFWKTDKNNWIVDMIAFIEEKERMSWQKYEELRKNDGIL